MNVQLKPRPNRPTEQPKSAEPQIGDRVEIAGMSKHQGVIIDIKLSPYSGFTCSVRVGKKVLEGVNPLALTKLC